MSLINNKTGSFMNKCAVVTGGASGIGLAVVELFLAEGVDVASIDRDEEALAASVTRLGKGASRLFSINADLSDLSHLPEVLDSAIARLGQADFLVNCAALTGGTLDLLQVSPEEMERAYALNVTAPLMLMQHFAKHVIARRASGKIVNLSSSSAYRARSTRAAYGASKAALVTLTRIAAAQLGAYDINVNAVAPGLTRTPALARAVPHTEEQLQAMVSEGPNANFLKRISEPEDIAQMVVFLCSDGARQITGQTIQVSAGAICI